MGAVPSLMLLFGSLMLPDTPNSLVQRGRPEEGRKILQKIRGTENVDTEVWTAGCSWSGAAGFSCSKRQGVALGSGRVQGWQKICCWSSVFRSYAFSASVVTLWYPSAFWNVTCAATQAGRV